VNDIAAMVLEQLGKPAELRAHVPERLGQVDRHIGSTDKAERLLGWRARTSFADGLERTVSWYRENEAWWRAILARNGSTSQHGGSSRPAALGRVSSGTAILPPRSSR
jgi:dTDP-glucose 4,6-dehydratase